MSSAKEKKVMDAERQRIDGILSSSRQATGWKDLHAALASPVSNSLSPLSPGAVNISKISSLNHGSPRRLDPLLGSPDEQNKKSATKVPAPPPASEKKPGCPMRANVCSPSNLILSPGMMGLSVNNNDMSPLQKDFSIASPDAFSLASSRRLEPISEQQQQPKRTLEEVFYAFASFGSATQSTEMDNAHFAKMCKECGFIDTSFTTVDVDMIFTKVKTKGARKITFLQFKTHVLREIAFYCVLTEDEVAARVAASAPKSSGTKAEQVNLHIDSANVNKKKKESDQVSPPAPPRPPTPVGLDEVFYAFASFGSATQTTEMDNAHFAKMCKECGFIDDSFTTVDVDMIFTKVKTKGARKITFLQFKMHVLREIAFSCVLSQEEVARRIAASAPKTNATKAEEVHLNIDANKERKKSAIFESEEPPAPPRPPTPEGLEEVFYAFASFGSATQNTEMDNAHFAKMCKECGFIDDSFTTVDVDMIFTKVKTKGARKISYLQFKMHVLREIAFYTLRSEGEVAERIASSAPKTSSSALWGGVGGDGRCRRGVAEVPEPEAEPMSRSVKGDPRLDTSFYWRNAEDEPSEDHLMRSAVAQIVYLMTQKGGARRSSVEAMKKKGEQTKRKEE